MLEARLLQGSLLKKTVDAVKDLVNEGNFECSAAGIQLQAMDTSHVCLVTLMLRQDGFEHYRCDRNRTLGISIANLAKVLKCAGEEGVGWAGSGLGRGRGRSRGGRRRAGGAPPEGRDRGPTGMLQGSSLRVDYVLPTARCPHH
jgi:hypothetical protein